MSLLLEALKKAELAKQQGAGSPPHAGEAIRPSPLGSAVGLHAPVPLGTHSESAFGGRRNLPRVSRLLLAVSFILTFL